MKKIVVNMTDLEFEKFALEALYEHKQIQEILRKRLLFKSFSKEVEDAFDKKFEIEFHKLTRGE